MKRLVSMVLLTASLWSVGPGSAHADARKRVGVPEVTLRRHTALLGRYGVGVLRGAPAVAFSGAFGALGGDLARESNSFLHNLHEVRRGVRQAAGRMCCVDAPSEMATRLANAALIHTSGLVMRQVEAMLAAGHSHLLAFHDERPDALRYHHELYHLADLAADPDVYAEQTELEAEVYVHRRLLEGRAPHGKPYPRAAITTQRLYLLRVRAEARRAGGVPPRRLVLTAERPLRGLVVADLPRFFQGVFEPDTNRRKTATRRAARRAFTNPDAAWWQALEASVPAARLAEIEVEEGPAAPDRTAKLGEAARYMVELLLRDPSVRLFLAE